MQFLRKKRFDKEKVKQKEINPKKRSITYCVYARAHTYTRERSIALLALSAQMSSTTNQVSTKPQNNKHLSPKRKKAGAIAPQAPSYGSPSIKPAPRPPDPN